MVSLAQAVFRFTARTDRHSSTLCQRRWQCQRG